MRLYKKNRTGYHLTILMVSLIIISIPQMCLHANAEVQNGVISFSKDELQKKGSIGLDGNWEFYWNKSYTPQDFKKPGKIHPDGYFPVPMYWPKNKKLPLPSRGLATYRLSIKSDLKAIPVSISIPEIYTEYRLFINGKTVYSHGRFSDGKTHFLNPRTFTVYNDRDEIEIILNIANERHGNAGIGQSLFIGTPENIENRDLFNRIMEIILIAVCIFAGIYHIILFSFRRKETELLYFGLFSIAVAVRTVSTGTSLIMDLFPELSFETGSRLATLIVPLNVMAFQQYVYKFFNSNRFKTVHRILMSIHMAYGISIFLTSTFFYSTLFTEYLMLIMISVAFVTFMTVHAYINKNRYSGIFMAGFSFIILGVLNDTLHYLQIINTGHYLSLFFSCFIIAQSIMLAIKFSREHTVVENLSRKLQVLDKLKDEFLANTSHELKTPLNGIIGISESLIEGTAGPLTEDVKYNLKLISSSGRRLSSLINDILDYSRLKNRDIVISEKDIDLKQTVSVVITIINSTIKKENVEIINNIPDRISTIRGDENRIQQILFNLLGNAVKFTEQGYIKVNASDEGNFIRVSVEDTGIGIPPESLENIFISFEQADGTISRKYGGTGLGLPITKNLVELLGGTIGVTSKPGKGSIFYFTMKKSREGDLNPLSDSIVKNTGTVLLDFNRNDSAHIKCTESASSSRIDEKVLIVDDETVNIKVIENYLSLEGYRTSFATNGEDALPMIEKESFDIVLLDIMMPRMSGFEVCSRLRRKYSSYELPVLMLTARNISHDIAAAFDSGANDYLVKPIDRNELLARIRTHISLSYAVDDAIKNAHLANTDELTGLYNRRFLMQSGKREFRNCRLKSKSFSVLMLDIDRFKLINDTLGHSSGDLVLKDIAEIIEKNIRGGDTAARYGGEEFTILLPATDLEGAKIAAEKLRSAIEKSSVINHSNREIKYTASIGISTSHDRYSGIDELIEEADRMLYKSKQEGRNRVSWNNNED